MTIQMQPVTSGRIAEIGYDPASHKLRIRFRDAVARNGQTIPGPVYEYDGIMPDAHAALVGADSIGAHFHRHIVGNRDLVYRRIAE